MEKPLILAIAAEPLEFSAFLELLGQAPPGPGYPLRAEAASDRYRWRLLANGPGPRLARDAVRMGLRWGRPDLVLSTGFCGGLEPSLAVGDIFVATEIRSGSEVFPARAPAAPRPASRGPLLSADRVVLDPFEKTRLLVVSGAYAVDMEAAEVARHAGGDLPFHCIRVVSDACSDSMPLDFNRYRDAEGRFDRRRITRAACLRPWTVPGLLRLRRDCHTAARTLARYLIECEF